VARSNEVEAAKRLIAFLASERTSGTITSSGMEPLAKRHLVTTVRQAQMSRLTKEQIQEHRSACEQWQRPEELLSRCEKLMASMSGEDFFNQPGLDFIREGWAAAMFGQARKADAVRLVPEATRWPDFEIRLNERVGSWEVTEADIPGRRRGQEYRDDPLMVGDKALGLDHTENYIARAERIPEAIRVCCETKAAKHYGERAGLLIYLNPSDFGTHHQEIVNSFLEATAPAKDSFTEICILWKYRFYPVWRDGRQLL
jgi:hypothetical protein